MSISRGTPGGSFGSANAGNSDAFVSKYDASGTLAWTRQFGTRNFDDSFGVSADRLGNVYVTGITEGNLGASNAGSYDAYIRKYDASGTLTWTRLLGTFQPEYSESISADRLGNVFITGSTYGSLGGANAGDYDAFLSKYDATGTLAWTKQIGTVAYDTSNGVSSDGLGNVYISGITGGNLEGPNAGQSDAFISKFDTLGTHLWTRQFGTSSYDNSWGVSADGLGNVFIAGATSGDLGGINAGGAADIFVSKYDSSGTLAWTRQLGTSEFESSFGISADGVGNVYISGNTQGSLAGPNAGLRDAFICKYDTAGTFVWSRQIGTSNDDYGSDVSADGLGNVYISGATEGSLWRPIAGNQDGFLVKYSDVIIPEPSAIILTITAILGGGYARLHRRKIITLRNAD